MIKEQSALAPVIKRILARLFDILLFLAFLVFAFLLFNSLLNNLLLINLAVNFFAFIFFVFYFVVVPYFFLGQTLGKKLWSIKLILSPQKKGWALFVAMFSREFYIMFVPVFLTWIFYGFYILLIKTFLNKSVEQGNFLSRTSVVFVLWWIFIFLFVKIEPNHQLFYDRWFGILVVESKVKTFETVSKVVASKIKKNNLPSIFDDVEGIDGFLNEEQKTAVFVNPDFNLRIIAGPGTGKTTVLINRIIFFLKKYKISPHQILILTFTRKASQNIKNKVDKNLSVFTYHGFCYWFLTVEKKISVTVLDQTDQKQLIKYLLAQNQENSGQIIDNVLVKEVLELINFLQQNMIYDFTTFQQLQIKSDFFSDLSLVRKKYLWDLYQKYLVYKKEEKLFDFVDLLVKAYQILQKDNFLLTKLRSRFHYLAVDEFQDTNILQYDLLKLITDSGKKIKTTVVGDPDQTIYGWRGSNIDFILNFHKKFKPLQTVQLVVNYRSQKNIVLLANHLIAQNKKRIAKSIVAKNRADSKIQLFLDDSPFDGAKFVVKQIEKLLLKGIKHEQIAILYRVNYLSGVLENFLLQRSIPYRIFKGLEFFKRKEVKDLLILLSIVLEPKDIYLQSVLGWIKGIGRQTIFKIQKQASLSKQTIFQYLSIKTPSFLIKFQAEIDHFLTTFQTLNQQLFQIQSLTILLEKLFNTLYQPILVNNLNYEQSLKNIDFLIKQVVSGFERSKPGIPIKTKIIDFLAQSQLSAADDLSSETQQIQLMTIHNAKGLEFDCVFIFDVSATNFPKKERKNIDLEEERRLFFVAITRAKKKVFITANDYDRSPFVNEIVDCSVVNT